MRLEALRKPEGNETQCPCCGGAVQRRKLGEMHAGSFVLDGERVDIRQRPDDHYQDPVVLDVLTQYFDGGLYRLWPSERYYTRGGKKLHREAWRQAFGDIPRGCHIHHRDGDPANNRIGNLECLPASEHLSLTWRESKGTRKKGEHFTDAARAAAADWHRSPEGRLWHKRHAERSQSWTKWKREPRNCDQCGIEFEALVRKSGRSQIYCTSVCKSAAYRERRRATRND